MAPEPRSISRQRPCRQAASLLTQHGEEQAHDARVGGDGWAHARVDGQVGEHAGQLDEHVLRLGRPRRLGPLFSFPQGLLGMQIQCVERME